jgi:hypothetical protein
VDDDGPPWRNDNSAPDNRSSDDHSAACSDTTRPMDTTRADDRACVHRAQGDEACCQQKRYHQMFHDRSPWVEACLRQSRSASLRPPARLAIFVVSFWPCGFDGQLAFLFASNGNTRFQSSFMLGSRPRYRRQRDRRDATPIEPICLHARTLDEPIGGRWLFSAA